MNPINIELFPGREELSKPLFNSQEDFQKWLDSGYEKIKLDVEENRVKRMNSIRDSLTRIVD
jgi:hypothetical protein